MNNSALGRASPGKARAVGSHRLGCSPSLAHSPCGAVRLDPPATRLHRGRSCFWSPQAAFTLWSMSKLSCALPRSLCPRASAGSKLLCSSAEEVWSKAGHTDYDCSTFILVYPFIPVCPSPSSPFGYFYIFGGQESSLILCSLCSPLQSLFWHSSHLS